MDFNRILDVLMTPRSLKCSLTKGSLGYQTWERDFWSRWTTALIEWDYCYVPIKLKVYGVSI